MKKKNGKFKKFLESKKTTAIALTLLLVPVLIFGFILIRDGLQTGEPVIGERNKNQLDPAIKQEEVTAIEESLNDELILNKKVTLKSSTLRVYLEVDVSNSKEEIENLAEVAYNQVAEILPIEKYFTINDGIKMYDLEIHVYNNSEDRNSEEFVYYEIIKNSSVEEPRYEFVSDARDPEYRDEVLENLAEKEAGSEDDKGGE